MTGEGASCQLAPKLWEYERQLKKGEGYNGWNVTITIKTVVLVQID